MHNKKIKKNTRKGQEEIAGFAIIIILVAVILLAFLGATLKKNSDKTVENYEVENFLQSALQQTTKCKISGEYVDIKDLIFECENMNVCENDEESCSVLEDTLKEMLEKSWKVGEGEMYLYKGYDMAILLNGDTLIKTIEQGKISGKRYYGATQDFAQGGDEVNVYFTLYY